jgi:polyhydroxyalkanoate synthesis regulator phasin
MNNGAKALCFALILGLALAVAGCSKKEKSNEVQDIDSIRAALKEQVDRGKLTKEEAMVRLAEAMVKYGSKEKKEEEGSKLSPKLEAYGDELKERVAKGEMTAEEAMTAWMEAAEKAKSSAKTSEDSVKEKE